MTVVPGRRVRALAGVLALALLIAIQVGQAGPAAAGSISPGTWPGTSGPVAASQMFGYPYPNAPQCTAGAFKCVDDAWKFYQGQCTSWVAYRLNQLNGIAFNDSYRGQHWGDATNWGTAARNLKIAVDGTPTVGSVAWYAGRSGDDDGHVAYVEQVNSPTSVVISEMNYDFANGFRIRTITAGGGSWPTGFIHLGGGSSVGLSITGPTLGTGTVGTSYSGTVTATGGTPPYSWSVTAGALPPGLSLGSASGSISGTPFIEGPSLFTLTVTDSAGNKASASASLQVVSPQLLVIRQGTSSALLGKVGLDDTWTPMGSFNGKLVISGNRIAVLTSTGELWAKDGLDGTWFNEAGNVTSFATDG